MDKREILKWLAVAFLVFSFLYFLFNVGGITANVVADDSSYIELDEMEPEVYGEKRPFVGLESHRGHGCSWDPENYE